MKKAWDTALPPFIITHHKNSLMKYIKLIQEQPCSAILKTISQIYNLKQTEFSSQRIRRAYRKRRVKKILLHFKVKDLIKIFLKLT